VLGVLVIGAGDEEDARDEAIGAGSKELSFVCFDTILNHQLSPKA
jgi:hypothetical protein